MKFQLEKILPRPGESFAVEYGASAGSSGVYHCHPECELTWIESGFGCRVVGSSIEPFAEGDLVLIGGMTPHHYLTCSADSTGPDWFRLLVVKFAPELWGGSLLALPEFTGVAALLGESGGGLQFPETEARRLAPLLAELPTRRGAGRVALLLELLDTLATLPRRRLCPAETVVLPANAVPDERLERVLGLIHRRIGRGRTIALDEAAAAACMTPPAFSRYFRRMTNRRFIDYVIEVRLSRAAAKLARTDRPVSAIALESGFANLSNFNRQFLRNMRLTPRAYRDRFLLSGVREAIG